MTAHPGREFDLVLFGATGFTGQLVSEYLAAQRPQGLRWALAGRSREKLAEVRAGLLAIDPSLTELPLVVVDSADKAALQRLASSTRVIGTTVGPYVKRGKVLLAACAAAGTHYCDITGEVPFIRWAIDAQDGRAKASGARIVSTCGFDSLPSDLGVFLLHEHLKARGQTLHTATFSIEKMKGGASGGTIASMMEMLEESQHDRALTELLGDPYALLPDRTRDRGSDIDEVGVHWNKDLQRWTAPFIMAQVNGRVVRRTNALLGFPYERDFRYSEVMTFPKGPGGLASATAVSTGMLAGLGLASLRPVRAMLKGMLPAPGSGPSREQRDKGKFRGRMVGKSRPDKTGTIRTAQVLIEFQHDPGYSETAKMFSEAALCLCFDDLPPGGGILTPAAAMGHKLVERLRAREQVWSVTDC